MKYKSEMYKGVKIKFVRMNSGYIGAFAPSRSSQYIGMGKTKTLAFEDLKKSVRRINKAGNW